MRVVRLIIPVVTALALAAVALAAAPTPVADVPAQPTGLHGFLLSPLESNEHAFVRTPSFSWNPVRGAVHYEFELSTSQSFVSNAVLWSASNLKTPAISVPISLPWITGTPYALYAHVRAVSQKGIGPWSQPYGFNMRWSTMPAQQASPSGMVRWTTVNGATGYNVWYLEPNKVFSTVTNVADEREYYTFHATRQWYGVVHWRVRAVRTTYGNSANGLPSVSYGPWSPVFTNTNPPLTKGAIALETSVSNVTAQGADARAHTLTPGFSWYGALSLGNQPGGPSDNTCPNTICLDKSFPQPTAVPRDSIGSLYRVYVFSDKDCVNAVFTSSLIGSPAYAPRTSGPLAIPGSVTTLLSTTDDALDHYLPDGTEPVVGNVMADATPVLTSETPPTASTTGGSTGSSTTGASTTPPATGGTGTGTGTGTGSGSGSGAGPGSGIPTTSQMSGQVPGDPAATSAAATNPAKVDLWDNDWPTSRYYWTVVPVKAFFVTVITTTVNQLTGVITTTTATSIEYHDLDLPQDACAAGRVLTFGKTSQPVVAAGKAPFAAGLGTSGRLTAAVHPHPTFSGTPLVSWQPAIGANQYEVQWSHKLYPWRTSGSTLTYSTSAVLPLKPGTWYYRVRGLDFSLPGTKTQMSWSTPASVVVAEPTFSVVKKS